MPHKHTRKGADKSNTDLPPSEIARPLPVSKSAAANGIFTTDLDTKRNNKKRKRSNKSAEDDTPRAFARLMAFQRGERLPKGLDDGIRAPKKKQKQKAAAAQSTRNNDDDNDDNDDDDTSSTKNKTNSSKKDALNAAAAAKEKDRLAAVPTIRPGERMSDFAARVDAALPVSGLINKSARGGKDPLGLKVYRTKTEKRMHRMYDEWREEERKIQDRKMEAMELAEEEQMDEDGQVKWKVDIAEAAATGASGSGGATGKSKKKGKKGAAGGRKKVLGEVDDGNDDPWAKIARDRAEVKAGLHDVVQAPPTFTKVPKEKFKMLKTSGGDGSGSGIGVSAQVDDVPRASGSLRRREELGDVRRSVVEGYRQMMKENRAKME